MFHSSSGNFSHLPFLPDGHVVIHPPDVPVALEHVYKDLIIELLLFTRLALSGSCKEHTCLYLAERLCLILFRTNRTLPFPSLPFPSLPSLSLSCLVRTILGTQINLRIQRVFFVLKSASPLSRSTYIWWHWSELLEQFCVLTQRSIPKSYLICQP